MVDVDERDMEIEALRAKVEEIKGIVEVAICDLEDIAKRIDAAIGRMANIR